jgi:hypothetical protein
MKKYYLLDFSNAEGVTPADALVTKCNLQGQGHLLEVGETLVPLLQAAKEKGYIIALGVPREGEVKEFIGLVHVVMGILGYPPLVSAPDAKGVHHLDQAMDLYDLMDDARTLRRS